MCKQVILWFAVTAFSLVTASPLLQAIASQTCPICERNALKNQLQNLLFQTANNYQPRPQMCLNQQPVQSQPDLQCKRSCPGFPQPVKSQLPYQQPLAQPMQPQFQQPPANQPRPPPQPQNTQHQANPLIAEAMNRLFSNPSMKSILDPTTKLFNQHGIEIPRNGPCSNGPPQVVNNYIIVPPEFLLDDKKVAVEKKKPANERRKKKKNNNVGERRMLQPENTSKGNKVGNMAVPANTARTNARIPAGQEQNQRGKVKTPEIKVNVVNKNPNPKPRESEITEVNIPNKETAAQIQFDKIVTSKTKGNDVGVIPVSFTEKTEVNPVKTKTTDAIKIEVQSPKDTVKTVELSSHTSNNSIKQGVNNTNKTTKKPKAKQSRNYNHREEAVVNDFKLKFPYIPEQVVRDLLSHMKHQLTGQNLGSLQAYYPPSPITFDQLYGNRYPPYPLPSITDINTKRNSNKTKKRKSKVRNGKSKTTTTPKPIDVIEKSTPAEEVATAITNKIEATTIFTETTTEVPTTTTTTTDFIAPTQVPAIVEMVTESIIIENVSKKDGHLIETTSPETKYTESNPQENFDKTVTQTEVKIPELGSEDIVPSIYLNDLDDEYYPDFTGDLPYYSGEDFTYFSLEDDRYHYTTDKNFPLEELNRERRRDAHASSRVRRPQDRHIFKVQNSDKVRPNARPIGHRRRPKFRTSPRLSHDINNVTPKVNIIVKENVNTKSTFVETNTEKPKSDEIQFRTPPTLEFIDFETKPINKDIFFRNDYKSSSYSEMKTPQYIFNKNMEKSAKVNEKQKSIDKIQTDFAGSRVATYGSSIFEDFDSRQEETPKQDKIIVMAQTVDGDYW